jgi:CxxC motif-containing protein
MKELTCIVCPNGCHLRVEEKDGELRVSGNRCPRGEAFGKQEVTRPMRTLCTTVRTAFAEVPVLPVRLSGEIPKDRMMDVMEAVRHVEVKTRLGSGDVVVKNVLGLGVDVIATSNILKGDL